MARRIAAGFLTGLILFTFPDLMAQEKLLRNPAREARLRARAEEYGQAIQQSNWSKASEFVNPRQREAYRRTRKTQVVSYTINQVTLEENRMRAQVKMTFKTAPVMGESVDLKSSNTWEWIDDEWFIVFKKSGPERYKASPRKKAVQTAGHLV